MEGNCVAAPHGQSCYSVPLTWQRLLPVIVAKVEEVYDQTPHTLRPSRHELSCPIVAIAFLSSSAFRCHQKQNIPAHRGTVYK